MLFVDMNASFIILLEWTTHHRCQASFFYHVHRHDYARYDLENKKHTKNKKEKKRKKKKKKKEKQSTFYLPLDVHGF